jgi:hypothetical protein
MLSEDAIRNWHVALFAAACAAVSATASLSRETESTPPRSYPVRIALAPAQPLPFVGAAIAFDLADGDDRGGGAIEIRKAVRLNGADAGLATIRVSEASTLQIAPAELGGLLARAGRADAAALLGGSAAEGAFVDFEDIRSQGIDVRYDAPSDRVLVAL